MMAPNQRKPGKRNISAWIPEEVWQRIERESKATGKAKSVVAEDMIRKGMKRAGIKLEDER